MAKSIIKLPNGTHITIDGKSEEIKNILSLYIEKKTPYKPTSNISSSKPKNHEKNNADEIDGTIVIDIVNIIKDNDESNKIEENILNRSSQIDRILLPLYIVNKYLDQKPQLTSGNISKILSELGVPIKISNVSTKLASSASKYVMQNTSRKKGQSTKYVISRRGIQYIASVISNS